MTRAFILGFATAACLFLIASNVSSMFEDDMRGRCFNRSEQMPVVIRRTNNDRGPI